MAHAQKQDFVFRRNGWVHLNRRGASVQSTAGSRGVRISGSNAGYTMFRGSVRVLATHSVRQFPLHFPSRASPCAIRFQTHYTSEDCMLSYSQSSRDNGRTSQRSSQTAAIMAIASLVVRPLTLWWTTRFQTARRLQCHKKTLLQPSEYISV